MCLCVCVCGSVMCCPFSCRVYFGTVNSGTGSRPHPLQAPPTTSNGVATGNHLSSALTELKHTIKRVRKDLGLQQTETTGTYSSSAVPPRHAQARGGSAGQGSSIRSNHSRQSSTSTHAADTSLEGSASELSRRDLSQASTPVPS